jgi:hypothetical protein
MTEGRIITETVAFTTFTWQEANPLKWEAITQIDEASPKYPQRFDLSDLIDGFEESFLQALKDLIIGRFRRVKPRSIEAEYGEVKRLLMRIQVDQTSEVVGDRLIRDKRIRAVNSGLLVAITAKLADEPNWIAQGCIGRLKDWFTSVGNGSVFTGIDKGDFPVQSRIGRENVLRMNIIAKALTRVQQIAVLKAVEDAFQDGKIDLGTYSLWNLNNYVYARPESLRQIRCGDLRWDVDPSTKERRYFISVIPAKRKTLKKVQAIEYPLTPFLGQLLCRQVEEVVQRNGPLYGLGDSSSVEEREHVESRLAMFPRRNAGTRRVFEVENFGMFERSSNFTDNYLKPLQWMLEGVQINFVAMRHTIGTQLAAEGVSAEVIQAVLLHANSVTGRRYIDLVNKSLREKLSAGLQEFPKLFPAYEAFTNARKVDALKRDDPQKVINSRGPIDPKTGEVTVETTGECGKHSACNYAPLSCYGCVRFIPNLDADHSINLRIVEERVERFGAMGRSLRELVERDTTLILHIKRVIMMVDSHKAEAIAFARDANLESRGEQRGTGAV